MSISSSINKSLSKINSSLHLIPIIFRFLRKNLQSKQNLFNEYNNLSHTIQKIISICSQYRHNHENELLFFKNKISQINYIQHCLEQYYKILHSFEYEIQRLQILLNNSQILEETSKIKLDRLIKENEKLKLLLNKQIEIDIKELQILKPILYNIEFEQKNIYHHCKQIKKQTFDLKTMENQFNNQVKTTTIQYDLARKQLNTLRNIYDKTNEKLLAIQTNEANIKQETENIKDKIITEQTHSIAYRNQIQNLRHQTQQLELSRLSVHHMVKSEEHTNNSLERKHLMLENNQLKLENHLENLTIQLTNLLGRNQMHKHILSGNISHLDNQQTKITTITIALKKLIHLNNNFERILQENRFIRINEQEKLHSIKRISFEKRKQLFTYTKRFHILSINENYLKNNTIRNSLEIVRLNNIFHNLNNIEKYHQLILRKKKYEMMKHEKQRASLNYYLHDKENQINSLNKKNQFLKNELHNKIDHFRLLNHQLLKQKHDQILISNKKQYFTYSYQQKLDNLNEIFTKFDQLEKLSEYESNFIIKKYQENQELKFDIRSIKQQIINLMSKNKRQIDEYSLLNEKIQLYTQLNNINNQQQQQYSLRIDRFSCQIVNLQEENNRLVNDLQNLHKKTMSITSSHHNNLLKKEKLYEMNQTISHQPLIIRDSPMRVYTFKSLENYDVFVNRLMKIIHQCVQWREKLLWIHQLYFTKIEQIHEQTKLLSRQNEIILRYKINSQIKQCKAMKAELRLQIH